MPRRSCAGCADESSSTALAVVCQATSFEADWTWPRCVRFRDLSDAEIERYLHAEQPYDCGGSAKARATRHRPAGRDRRRRPTALSACRWSAPAACCAAETKRPAMNGRPRPARVPGARAAGLPAATARPPWPSPAGHAAGRAAHPLDLRERQELPRLTSSASTPCTRWPRLQQRH